MSADSSRNYMSTAGFGLNLASREEMGGGFFVPFGNNNKAANLSGTEAGSGAAAAGAGVGAPHPSSSFLQDMISLSSANGFVGSAFDDTFSGMLSPKKDCSGGGGGGGGDGEGMTRDFLGLRPLSENDILSIAALSTHVGNQNQTQKSWQGN